MNKLYLSLREFHRVLGLAMDIDDLFSSQDTDCWICDMFRAKLDKDEKGYFLPEDVFEDDGIVIHLEQLIERELTKEEYELIFGKYEQEEPKIDLQSRTPPTVYVWTNGVFVAKTDQK